jgi:hypothetical protein
VQNDRPAVASSLQIELLGEQVDPFAADDVLRRVDQARVERPRSQRLAQVRERFDAEEHVGVLLLPLHHRGEPLLELENVASHRVLGVSLLLQQTLDQHLASSGDGPDLAGVEDVSAHHVPLLIELLPLARVEPPGVCH